VYLTFKTDESHANEYMDYAFLNKIITDKIEKKEEAIVNNYPYIYKKINKK
jgi:hypothetical protein